MENNVKEIGNRLYNAGLITVGIIASRYATKAFGFKERPIEFKLKSVGMLVGEVATSAYVVKTLQDSKALPDKIFT